jgi:hypothetical protein
VSVDGLRLAVPDNADHLLEGAFLYHQEWYEMVHEGMTAQWWHVCSGSRDGLGVHLAFLPLMIWIDNEMIGRPLMCCVLWLVVGVLIGRSSTC